MLTKNNFNRKKVNSNDIGKITKNGEIKINIYNVISNKHNIKLLSQRDGYT